MSRENVDTLRAVYEEWARGNFRAGVDLYDEHVLYLPVGGLPDVVAPHIGPEGIREYMRGQLQAWTRLTIAGEEFIEAGDSVVVAAHWVAVGKESVAPVEARLFHVWTFRGAAVTRLELFRHRSEALEAVGLRE
jgi:ketosteroid isomerase-like protein